MLRDVLRNRLEAMAISDLASLYHPSVDTFLFLCCCLFPFSHFCDNVLSIGVLLIKRSPNDHSANLRSTSSNLVQFSTKQFHVSNIIPLSVS